MRLDALHQLRLGHETHDPLDHLAVLEQDHGRDPGDTKVHWCLLVLVDVELDDLQLAALLGSNLLEHRPYHTARATPFGPEVDQNGRLAADLILERAVGNLCELSQGGES